jgi:hypothetical protein
MGKHLVPFIPLIPTPVLSTFVSLLSSILTNQYRYHGPPATPQHHSVASPPATGQSAASTD